MAKTSIEGTVGRGKWGNDTIEKITSNPNTQNYVRARISK